MRKSLNQGSFLDFGVVRLMTTHLKLNFRIVSLFDIKKFRFYEASKLEFELKN